MHIRKVNRIFRIYKITSSNSNLFTKTDSKFSLGDNVDEDDEDADNGDDGIFGKDTDNNVIICTDVTPPNSEYEKIYSKHERLNSV